jgi:hypothetical protein
MTKQKKTPKGKDLVARPLSREVKSQTKRIARLFRQLQTAFNSKPGELQDKVKVLEKIEEVNASLAIIAKHWPRKPKKRVTKFKD